MKIFKAFIFLITVTGALFFNSASVLAADTMTQVTALDFGTFALLNNTSSHTLVISPANAVTPDASIIVGTPAPHRGQYTLSLPGVPNMALTLGVIVVTPPLQGGMLVNNSSSMSLNANPLLTVDTFTTNNPTTDGAGNATLYIGATMRTSGTGSTYGNGAYSGTYDIIIYF